MGNKGYKRWSRDITRKLDTMMERDKLAIMQIMDREAEKTREYMVNNIPVDTGELQSNIFLDHYETDNGYGVGVGIASTLHNPDTFTNTKLSGWLLHTPNKKPTYSDIKHGRKVSNSQEQMRGIVRELESLKYNVADEIKIYWKSKQK